ncbi:MAG TPA: response regulator [Salinivirga sp.]|uniref:response regulator n=1 Tax=Salinivirga sp. TaxID=1970192 RepID=UPI002B48A7B2|nr:response regulator [Salinivirga sp.]HKK59017.1 response regulator [Salinivirga sp.]
MQSKDILIVDDAENNLILLSDLLSEFEYNIRVAHNGSEALDLVREKAPDLILLDIMMPEMDGFELLEKIKPQIPSVKTIFITAKSNEEDRKRAFELGAADFITKPVNIMQVMDIVKRSFE